MPSQRAVLLGGLLFVAAATVAQRRGQEAGGRRRTHRVQHGQCSYTFVLPEPDACLPKPQPFGASNSLQRDSPATVLNLGDWPNQRVRQLEKMLENNTQWLQKVRRGLQGERWRAGERPPGAFPGAEARLLGHASLSCADWMRPREGQGWACGHTANGKPRI
ncbi:Angiopoietin-4 [Galemys pyrenaicus]|uniref:Angiopoietin-4 n=1 Tax=Galemys pyrenaicus TaxID=202257 RepID=A0A8J6AU87_GALPY|nr:Angiopoietin-4 [Galemys pyrenaicus]